MDEGLNRGNPLREFFGEAVHIALSDKLGLRDVDEVEIYLAEMLVLFMHDDKLFAIRDQQGQKVRTVVDMLAEGDIRLKAESFERERTVHKHIGDFILFWSGLYPEFLTRFRRQEGLDCLVDYTIQAQESYHIVSTFDYGPYAQEAPVFKRLSSEFEAFRIGLNMVRANLPGLSP